MSNLDERAAFVTVSDVVEEYLSDGEFWGEDEIAEAFRDIVPDLQVLLNFLEELL